MQVSNFVIKKSKKLSLIWYQTYLVMWSIFGVNLIILSFLRNHVTAPPYWWSYSWSVAIYIFSKITETASITSLRWFNLVSPLLWKLFCACNATKMSYLLNLVTFMICSECFHTNLNISLYWDTRFYRVSDDKLIKFLKGKSNCCVNNSVTSCHSFKKSNAGVTFLLLLATHSVLQMGSCPINERNYAV